MRSEPSASTRIRSYPAVGAGNSTDPTATPVAAPLDADNREPTVSGGFFVPTVDQPPAGMSSPRKTRPDRYTAGTSPSGPVATSSHPSAASGR